MKPNKAVSITIDIVRASLKHPSPDENFVNCFTRLNQQKKKGRVFGLKTRPA